MFPLSPLGAPQWNCVSERRNQTMLDVVKSIMNHSDLANSFWRHVLLTITHTLNHVQSKMV